MNQIVVGVLKSENPVKLKKALVKKLCQNRDSLKSVSINELIFELEKIWSIEAWDEMTSLDPASMVDKLKLAYDSLGENFEVLLELFQSIVQSRDHHDDEFASLDTHISNMFKLTFMPNLNRPVNSIVVKTRLSILMNWWRILIESLLTSLAKPKPIDITSSIINILHILNLNLAKYNPDSINFFYFIQNDTKFCLDYLKMVQSSFDLVETVVAPDMQLLVDSCLLETIYILVKSVAVKQTINPDQKAQVDEQLVKHQKQNVNFLKEVFSNLNLIVGFVKSAVSKSGRIFEFGLKYLIDVLCSNSMLDLNQTVAQVLTCFDIGLASVFVKNFLKEADVSIDDQTFKNLLSNLIFLLNWPFESNVSEWIIMLMTILAVQCKKFKLLVLVCEENCDYVLDLVQNKSTSKGAFNVFAFFLINYRHSPKLFHKSCPRIIRILTDYKSKIMKDEAAEKDETTQMFLDLSLLAFICTTNFGGYPQLYKPILEIIQNDIDFTNFDSFVSKYAILDYKAPSDDIKTFSNEMSDDLIGAKLKPNVTGLINLGNTCYLNSMVQSLFACRKFVRSILGIDLEVEDRSFLGQIQTLFSLMFLTNRPSVKPIEFVKHCTPKWFKFGQQQDSSEFLVYFLDSLNEQLKSYPKFASLIQENFGIRLNTRIKCLKCSKTTSRTDTSFSLPLSFVSSDQPLSLQTLVNNYFHQEQLSTENGNSYSCSSCVSLQNATKRIRIEHDAPNYLILTLNRFVYQSTSSSNAKIMDRLEYPRVIEVDIGGPLDDDEVAGKDESTCHREKYSCMAIVIHSGSSLHYGHYYSYIYETNNSPEWLLANDSQITQTSFDGLIANLDLFKNDTPYVLVYSRCDEAAADHPHIQISRRKLIDWVESDNRALEAERSRAKRKFPFNEIKHSGTG